VFYFIVDQGRLAQQTAAPSQDGAAVVGETDVDAKKRSVWDKLRTYFFKDNPTCEF
jgi:hypothetical protein